MLNSPLVLTLTITTVTASVPLFAGNLSIGDYLRRWFDLPYWCVLLVFTLCWLGRLLREFWLIKLYQTRRVKFERFAAVPVLDTQVREDFDPEIRSADIAATPRLRSGWA